MEKENCYEKRIRIIFDQLLPGIADDIVSIPDSGFRVDYLGKLEERAYNLVEKQSKYTDADVTTNFDSIYRQIKEELSLKKS